MMLGVPPGERLDAAWPEVAPFIARGLEEADGELAIDDVRAALDRRDMQLWLWLDAKGEAIGACVTEIKRYPRKAICHVIIGGGVDGRREEWLPGLQVIERWARLQGCTGIHVDGRKAWVRLLAGYTLKRVVLSKAL